MYTSTSWLARLLLGPSPFTRGREGNTPRPQQYGDAPHFQVALPLRGEAVTAAPPALVAEESGRCRGVVEGDRQESGVGSNGLRDEAVDRAGEEVAEHGFMLSRLLATRLPPGDGATLAPVAPSAFM